MISENDDRVLTPAQVADRLQISTDQVYALIKSGQLVGKSISTGSGRRVTYRVTLAALSQFLGSSIEDPKPTSAAKPKLKVRSFLAG